MNLTTHTDSCAEDVRLYLRLSRLLDGIQWDHPEVSAPLRLALLRARRDGQIARLDEGGFRAVVADLDPGQAVHGAALSRPRERQSESLGLSR